jgi:hypothetical protein
MFEENLAGSNQKDAVAGELLIQWGIKMGFLSQEAVLLEGGAQGPHQQHS